MNNNFKMKENVIKIYLDEKIYPLIAIKKAMFNYLDIAYIEAKTVKKKIEVTIEFTNNNVNYVEIEKNFINDCLRESLRYDISKETKNIRELILGRALYTSCIQIDEQIANKIDKKENFEIIEEDDYDLEKIAVNWFNNKGDN